ncbi:MAG: LysE family translocator [Litorimonas sp.]
MDFTPYISWENLLPFLLVCLVIEVTPGPNMAFLSIVSATKGRSFGYSTVLGVTLGLAFIGFVSAAGLATVLSNTPILYHGLRFAGAGYLLWLAWIEWQNEDPNISQNLNHVGLKRAYFRHGFLVNVLNPKAVVFYATILPGFIDPNGFVLQQALVLTTISIAIATFAHLLIVSLAGALKPFLENPTYRRIVRRGFSITLALIAIWVCL